MSNFYYRNNSEAKVGDIVRGWVDTHAYKITGKVIALHEVKDEFGEQEGQYVLVAHVDNDTMVLLPPSHYFTDFDGPTIIGVTRSYGNLYDFERVG